MKRNEMKRNEMKRNEMKRNEMERNEMEGVKSSENRGGLKMDGRGLKMDRHEKVNEPNRTTIGTELNGTELNGTEPN